jgi:hypothetical protein
MNPIKPEITDDMIEQFRRSFGKVVTPETEALAGKLSDEVFAEISSASRAAKPNEILVVQRLISTFNSYGIQIDEVRYMDAASLIFAMHLPGNTKQCCLSILEAPSREAISFIMEALSKSQFSDELFKTKILGDIFAGCAKSKVCRNLFVTLIARILSQPFQSAKIVNGTTDQTHSFGFHRSQLSESGYNSIAVDYEDETCYRSFFHHSSAVKEVESGVFAYTDDTVPGYTLYHESGHSISSDFFNVAFILGMDKTMELMSRITTAIPDELALHDFFDRLKTAPPDIQDIFVKSFNGIIGRISQNIDETKSQMFQILLSQDDIVKLLFSNVVEIFQIIGLALLNHNDKNTLYINLLSDFNLILDLGMPIRCAHRAWRPDTAQDIYKFLIPQKLYVQHRMNADFYGALLPVYGSTMEQYVSKLMFGENLIRYLKQEYEFWRKCAEFFMKRGPCKTEE